MKEIQHYALSALCDLGDVNVKISGTFSERLVVGLCLMWSCRWARIEFVMHIQACCYKDQKVDFIHAFHSGNTGMQKISKLAEGSQGKLHTADQVNINRW